MRWGKRDDRDGAKKSDDRAKRPNDAQPSEPEAQQNQRAEQQFRRAEEESGASNSKGWDQPENQWAVADKRCNLMGFETKPLLVAKYVESESHHCTNQVIVKVAPERSRLREIKDKRVHPSRLFFLTCATSEQAAAAMSGRAAATIGGWRGRHSCKHVNP